MPNKSMVMKFSRFTEKYLERISSLSSIKELITDNAIVQRETLDKIKEKGYTLSRYNGETSEYVDFYYELKFIEEGINGSWKDNISSEFLQEYYLNIRKRVEKTLKDKL